MSANPYNAPESHGLAIFGCVEELSYEFDMLVVWEDTRTGDMFWAWDRGCSCPAPFEDFSSRDDLTPVTHDGWAEFFTAAHKYHADGDELANRVSIRLSELERKDRLTPFWRESIVPNFAELARLNNELARYKEIAEQATLNYEALANGVKQQEQLWDLLRTVHRELDMWFHADVNAEAAKAQFTITPSRALNTGIKAIDQEPS